MTYRVVMLLLGSVALCASAAGSRATHPFLGPKPTNRAEGYSFAQFVSEFGRSYSENSQEAVSRQLIFQTSLARIHAVNALNAKQGRTWNAGVHPFMDWSEAERKSLHGYKPAVRDSSLAALQTGARAGSRMNMSMPSSYDGGTPAQLRDQGNCGSCWAISAAEAVEAQLRKQGKDQQVSAQALVDCVPNPQHCGGSGGCDGATGELAYTYMRDQGIPLEQDLQYNAQTGACPNTGSGWSGSRVMVSGWKNLASNQAQPLLNAIVEDGPVVVAVDANNWFDYERGVFDGCSKDATLGHAVLAVGFGNDAGTGYWDIQNSWGAGWGERGHIRIKRHDDEDSWCGQDRKPKEGLACDGGPSEITVCGMCGLLYDPVVPTGVRIEDGSSGAEAPAPVMAEAAAPEKASGDGFGPDAEATPVNAFPRGDGAGFGVDAEAQAKATGDGFGPDAEAQPKASGDGFGPDKEATPVSTFPRGDGGGFGPDPEAPAKASGDGFGPDAEAPAKASGDGFGPDAEATPVSTFPRGDGKGFGVDAPAQKASGDGFGPDAEQKPVVDDVDAMKALLTPRSEAKLEESHEDELVKAMEA